MNLKEFRDYGYLQEANRRFFHPLGLVLSVTVTETTGGYEECLVIFDSPRDDKEGFIFPYDDPPEKEKYERVQGEWVERSAVRLELLGYDVQPVDGG